MLDQTTELEAVKRKIRALANVSLENGASETEAMFAMRRLGDMLLQYNLSMNDVMLRDEPCIIGEFSTESKHRNSLWSCFSGIQAMCGVKVWYERSHNGIVWKFFGLESDVRAAEYLADLIQKSEKRETAWFKTTATYHLYGGHKRIATNNFIMGFGERLCSRLHQIAAENVAAEREAADHHATEMADKMIGASDEAKVEHARRTTGTALVCVAKAARINEEFKKHGPKLRTVKARRTGRYTRESYEAGQHAGNRVNLNRPIEDGKKSGGLLT